MYCAFRSSTFLLRASRGISSKGTRFDIPLNCGLVPALQGFTSAKHGHFLTNNYSTNLKKIQDSKEIIYRYKWIKQLRFISRVKIVHVFIVGGLTGPMSYWFNQGIISGSVLVTSIFAATATTAGLFALSYFFRRVIGELSFDPIKEEITISSLTFWGNRRNLVVPISNFIPLSDRDFDPKNLFHRVELYGNDFVYLLNLRHGRVYDSERLLQLLGILQERVKNADSYKPASGHIVEVESGDTVGRS
ncbi:transmembrane protein 186-like [Actinia tenebrosa]|uniref:Transmembrane protein 186 n=1 Tax=Actinia tenebrosa TaxID=6105 RepID=A0A6P8IM74_ACTTE|nr:transmembrane protein 186-like [Actinia tenebrosa]